MGFKTKIASLITQQGYSRKNQVRTQVRDDLGETSSHGRDLFENTGPDLYCQINIAAGSLFCTTIEVRYISRRFPK